MTIAKMVREMIARGVDPEVIELAVATAEEALSERASADVRVTERDEQAERRRERDRGRQQRYRDSLRINRDNPQTSADVTNASLSKEDKKEGIKEERGERKRDVRGQRLPEIWQPTPPDIAIADELLGGWERRQAELEKFIDHWKQQPGSKGVKLDWNAAWRNWIRRAAEYRGGANGHRTANPRATGHDAILAAAARAAGKIAGDGAMARTTDADEFPIGNGIDGHGASVDRRPAEGSPSDRHGREFGGGRVLEGEIIAPDKAAAGLPGGGRSH